MKTRRMSHVLIVFCIAMPVMAAGTPSVSSVAPSFGEQAGSYLVVLAGSNFTGATSVSFGLGITVDHFSVESDTRITAHITIALTAATGWRAVTVTTPAGSDTRTTAFRVDSGAPAISSVVPSFGEQAESCTVVLTGSRFGDVTGVSFDGGITVDDFSVESDTRITAHITIAQTATTGWRTVTVTTPLFSGMRTNGFRVDSGAPLIDSVEPSSCEQGKNCAVLLAGSNFAGAVSVSFGAGIDVGSFTVDGDTRITVQITVGQTAVTGWRTVTVTTPLFSGVRTNSFRVDSGSIPVSPPTVSTDSATGVEGTCAALNGQLADDGGQACEYRFRYGKSGGAYSYTSWTGAVTSGQSFTETVGNLEAGTTYSFAAQAKNSAGAGGWGAELSFTTAAPPVEKPTVTTTDASDVDSTSAILSGCVTGDGGEACEYRFSYYPLHLGPGAQVKTGWECCAGAGQAFTCMVAGLTPAIQYCFVAEARNSAGAATGGQGSFTTTATPALAISSTAGGAVVNPGEGEFSYAGIDAVDVEAAPGYHCKFGRWTGSAVEAGRVVDPGAASTTVTVDDSYTLKAHFVSLLDVIHVDDDALNDPGPGDPTLSDRNEDGTRQHPFDSIQEAIEVARDTVRVLVHEGVYRENVDLLGRRITVEGLWLTDPNVPTAPVIEGVGGGPVLRFSSGENPDCQLAGLIIAGAPRIRAAAIECRGTSPVISHCIIAGNRAAADGGAVMVFEDCGGVLVNCTVTGNVAGPGGAVVRCTGSPGLTLVNSILWGNTGPLLQARDGRMPLVSYCDLQEAIAGAGNISFNPLFVDAGRWDINGTAAGADDDAWIMGDYHLLSERGRFRPDYGDWAPDETGSPCIDAGDPGYPWPAEPSPNGGRVNMGAYGGTRQASLSSP